MKLVHSKNAKGFSIVELMISMVVFLIAIGAVYSVSRSASIQKNSARTRIDQIRAARTALEYLRRDALNAGYGFHRVGALVPDGLSTSLFTLPNDADTQRDFFTSVMPGNNVFNNTISGTPTDSVTFISQDSSAVGGGVIEFKNTNISGSRIDLVTTDPAGAAPVRNFDLYLISPSSTTQFLGIVTSVPAADTISFDFGDPLGINQSASAAGDLQNVMVPLVFPPSPPYPVGTRQTISGAMKKVQIFSYHVTPAGVLVRSAFGNNSVGTAAQQIQTRELVTGVRDFQIKYFISDLTTVDDPTNGNDGRDNQIKSQQIVQMQVSITITPDDADGGPQAAAPLTITEYISVKNLRYEVT